MDWGPPRKPGQSHGVLSCKIETVGSVVCPIDACAANMPGRPTEGPPALPVTIARWINRRAAIKSGETVVYAFTNSYFRDPLRFLQRLFVFGSAGSSRGGF
jgi:hypothetical protein